jgi:hypothetical protein
MIPRISAEKRNLVPAPTSTGILPSTGAQESPSRRTTTCFGTVELSVPLGAVAAGVEKHA